MIQLAGSVLIVLCAVLATASPVVYGAYHKWWRSSTGRHIFTYMTVLAVVVDLWALRLVVPEGGWFVVVRLVAFSLLPWVFAWRLLIIVKAVLAEKRERKEGGN